MRPEEHWQNLQGSAALSSRQKLKLCWPLLAILAFLFLCAALSDLLDFISLQAPTMGYMPTAKLVPLLEEWFLARMLPIMSAAIFLAIIFRLISRRSGK